MVRHLRTREVSKILDLPPRRCYFFKIILEANIRYRRLRIPRKFIRKFRDELSDIAVLKGPSGKIWSIGLRKSNREVWFDKGWQEFVEYHSIFENHFLVFRYDGNSNFYVFIFDTTACEIEYPSGITDYEENNPKGGCQIEEMEEIFDVPPRPCQTTVASRKVTSGEPEEQWMAKNRGRERNCLRLKKEEKSNEEQSFEDIFDVPPRPSQRLKQEEKFNEEQSCEEIFVVPPRPSQTTVASRKVMSEQPEQQAMAKSRERSGLRFKQEKNKNIPCAQRFVHAKYSVSKRPILAWERERQLQAATDFKSTNPFCTVNMHPSFVSGLYVLNVPRSFARKFITATSQGVTLHVPDGRRWHMYFSSVRGGSTKIFKGWKVFAQENNLEVGDICIFELVKKSPTELKVFIYRFAENVAAQRS